MKSWRYGEEEGSNLAEESVLYPVMPETVQISFKNIIGECDVVMGDIVQTGVDCNDRKQTFMIRLENDDGNMMSGCVLECYYCLFGMKLDKNSPGCVKVFSAATQHTEHGTELN